MKSPLSFVLILLIALLGSCSGGSGDLSRYGLKGKVKEFLGPLPIEIQCDPTYDNDHWVASDRCEQGFRLLEFNGKGQYLRSMIMSLDDDTLNMVVPKRENENLVEEVYYTREYLTPRHSRLVPVSRYPISRSILRSGKMNRCAMRGPLTMIPREGWTGRFR